MLLARERHGGRPAKCKRLENHPCHPYHTMPDNDGEHSAASSPGSVPAFEYACKLGTGQPGEYLCIQTNTDKRPEKITMRVAYTDFDNVGATNVGDTSTMTATGRKIVVTTDDNDSITLVPNSDNHCIYFADGRHGVLSGECRIGRNSFTVHAPSITQTFRLDAWGAPTSADDAKRDGGAMNRDGDTKTRNSADDANRNDGP